MNPLAPILYLFDWRGVLARGVYRRNVAILYLTNALMFRLHLLHGGPLLIWILAVMAIGLSFDARRFHDMGFSAAWIVWIYLVGGAFICAAIVLLPDLGDHVPRPLDPELRRVVDALPWRFLVPIALGTVVISVVRRIWLVTGPSLTVQNRYARPQAAFWKTDEVDSPDESAMQAMIDRHLARRREEALAATPSHSPQATGVVAATGRRFGKRGL